MIMSKLKIFLWHLLVFVLGSALICAYVFFRLTAQDGGAGLAGVIVMPAVILAYIIVFGILCAVSLTIWLLVVYFRGKKAT